MRAEREREGGGRRSLTRAHGLMEELEAEGHPRDAVLFQCPRCVSELEVRNFSDNGSHFTLERQGGEGAGEGGRVLGVKRTGVL